MGFTSSSPSDRSLSDVMIDESYEKELDEFVNSSEFDEEEIILEGDVEYIGE